jgi:hypothetical protein
MKCAKCGEPLPGGAVFCPDCGEPAPAGMPTVQLPVPGPGYGGAPPQAGGFPPTSVYPAPQGYQPPPPTQHYGAQQQGYPPAGWGQAGVPGPYVAQPPPGYVAPRYTPAQRKSDPLLVCMGVVFILFSLIPLIWIYPLRAPISQWIWMMDFLSSVYFSQSNRLIGSACVLFLMGVPGVILFFKGLRR